MDYSKMLHLKVEIFFLIHHLELAKSETFEKSEIVEEQNKKIEKCRKEIINSNYKNVNNFSYVTYMLHYFFKITEHYFFKYFNSIIVDSVLFFKFTSELNHLKAATATKIATTTMAKADVDADANAEGELHIDETKDSTDSRKQEKLYKINHLDYESFQLFIENLKKGDEEQISKKEKVEKEKKKKYKNESFRDVLGKKEKNINGVKKEAEKMKKIDYSTPKRKFRKNFLYGICEASSSCDNKKERMVAITKIFRRIIDRSKVRTFICENDQEKKMKYLQFFLNLSFGIYIYTYIYKYIKENYKSVKYFFFINNFHNLRQIYLRNHLYLEKDQIFNFIHHIKNTNIKIFQFIYISYFVNIYQHVNYIYNLSMLTLFKYFTCLMNAEKREMDAADQTNSTNQTNTANLIKEGTETSKWNVDPFFSELKTYINYSSVDKVEYLKEVILDCYLYNFIFFKYIKNIRNQMKLFIIKIQNNVKKMMNTFSQIYHFNNQKKEVEKRETLNQEKRINQSEDNNSTFIFSEDAVTFLYIQYVKMSKYYKCCVKLSYKIIKYVHLFNALLKHFFKCFPVLVSKNNNYIIYNYWDQSLIYMSNSSQNMNFKPETKMNAFKNISQYGIDFFYFTDYINENKKEAELIDIHKKESFNFLFNTEVNKKEDFSATFDGHKNEIEENEGNQKNKENKENKEKKEEIEFTGDVKYTNVSEVLKNPMPFFLYCLNNDRDSYIINIDDSSTIDEFLSEYTKKEEQREKNSLKQMEQTNEHSFSKHPIVQILKKRKNYKEVIEIIENKYDKHFPFVKNYFKELHHNDIYALEIYNSTIFDISYKVEQKQFVEDKDLLRNKKLLQIKIFLDYEKVYKKKTAETQTSDSYFRKSHSIQMSKDKEISTVSEQYAQTKKTNNPIFYLKDIYD